MNENYQNPDFQPEMEEEDEIDWMGYLNTLWSNRKAIIKVTAICAVLSVVIALCQKRTYHVGVTLAPEVQSSSSRSGSLSGIASMLGIGGVAMGSSTDALNITIFPEIVNSTPFIVSLFDVELTPYVSPKKIEKGAAPGVPVSLYDHLRGKDKEPGLIKRMLVSIFGEDPDEPIFSVSNLTKKQSLAVEKMRKLMSADVDKKTGVTSLSVTLDDPLMAVQLADTVCRRLQEYVFEYRTQKERENLSYYSALTDSAYVQLVAAQAAYAQSMDNDHSVILQSVSVRKQRLQNEMNLREQVYSQMLQQRELVRGRVQEMKPVFAVVEPATFPQYPVRSRAKTCIVITFLGFVATCAWYLFGASFYASMKEKLAAKKEEEEAVAE